MLPEVSIAKKTVIDLKGSFTPNDSVTITATFMGGTFGLFDGHCDGQNGLHTLFAAQRNVVVWCE